MYHMRADFHLLKVVCMSAVQDKGGTIFFQGPHNVSLVGCLFSNSTARVSIHALYHTVAMLYELRKTTKEKLHVLIQLNSRA